MTDPQQSSAAEHPSMSRSVRDRFTSKPLAAARFLAQRAVLKPVVWSLLRVRIVGRAKLREAASLHGGFIVVANHSSHLDAPLIMCSLPRRLARYLAAAAAGDYFFEVWWRRGLTALFFNAFPVDRAAKRAAATAAREPEDQPGPRPQPAAAGTLGAAPEQIAAAPGRPVSTKSLLRRGIPVLVFPEGTRSHDGELGTFQPGAAALAASCRVPLLPVALVGAHEAQPRGSSWPKAGRPSVSVVFGDPMLPARDEEPLAFIERIRSEIARLREHHDAIATPHRPAKSEGASA